MLTKHQFNVYVKTGFGIKYSTLFDLPETKPNQKVNDGSLTDITKKCYKRLSNIKSEDLLDSYSFFLLFQFAQISI